MSALNPCAHLCCAEHLVPCAAQVTNSLDVEPWQQGARCQECHEWFCSPHLSLHDCAVQSVLRTMPPPPSPTYEFQAAAATDVLAVTISAGSGEPLALAGAVSTFQVVNTDLQYLELTSSGLLEPSQVLPATFVFK